LYETLFLIFIIRPYYEIFDMENFFKHFLLYKKKLFSI